jgi:octaprenyl-diphosphate synthase
VLYLLGDATETQRAKLNKLVLKGEPMDTTLLAGIADYAGAIERAVKTAHDLLQEARKALVILPASHYHDALSSITIYLDDLLDQCRGVV